MKKILVILFIFSINNLFAQDQDNPAPFPRYSFGVYSGINFGNISESGGTLLIEVKTNLMSNFNIKLSTGYSKSFMHESYTVKTYSMATIDGTQFYLANQYDVNEKGYDVFPISLGFQYVYKNKTFSPYLLIDFNYNLIDTKIYSSPGSTWTYDSFNSLPADFKTKHFEVLPNSSYGIMFGVGTIYQLSARLNLDLRYYYKIDSKIINTHQLIVGISL
jgi:opacity protein-like surface antigen